MLSKEEKTSLQSLPVLWIWEERNMKKKRWIRKKEEEIGFFIVTFFFLVHTCLLHSEARGETTGSIETVYFDKGFFFPFFFKHYHFLQAVQYIIVDERFVADLVFMFPLWYHADYLPIPKMMEHSCESSIGTESISSLLISVSMLSSTIGPCCQFVESKLLSWQPPELLEIFMWPLWPIAQLVVSQSWYWKLSLVTIDVQLGLFLTYYLALLFRLLSYMYIFS